MNLSESLIRMIRTSLLRDENAELGPEDSLIDAGVLDSIGLMSIISHVEDLTSVRIPDAEVTPHNFETVVAITELVRKLRDR